MSMITDSGTQAFIASLPGYSKLQRKVQGYFYYCERTNYSGSMIADMETAILNASEAFASEHSINEDDLLWTLGYGIKP